MKRFVLISSLALLGWVMTSTVAQAQYNNWSVGVRLGEPSGINVRKYFGNNRAFDLNIGTYGGLYGTKRSYGPGDYRSVGLTVQGHYLWHTAVTKSESIRAYYGFGGQINNRRTYPLRLNGEYQKTLSLGGSGIGGLEFFPVNKPYSIFLETGAYVELLQSPFFLSLNTGIGLRYNF
ncbi:hypothetical protein [Spirosoma radiotolerans]|uniref:Outer membrane protein beta-barrel domain-containing protein n=1 Tax=Spirosoma radiotolerans TaxID=1379870 RepID=A0A0E3V7C2_9BACT|nr:hypothetical protein [Spirosoma radiotolerans]AKD55752.1 hypothetical protein SD10_13425 [Spirosoma radiotolerans]